MRPLTQSKPFFATLDAIRGVAAILVMMRHVPYFTGFQESYLAVDVFFLLSGVVIANAYEQRLLQGLSIRRFTLMRVVRIYPLYLLGCALMLLALYRDGTPGLPDWQPWLTIVVLAGLLLPNLAGDPPFPLNHPAWSLFFEMAANLFYAAIVRWLSTRRLLVLIGASALGLGFTLLKSGQTNLDLGWSCATLRYGVARVGYSFFAGILLYRCFVSYGGRAVDFLSNRKQIAQSLSWLIVALIAAILTAGPAPAWQPWFDFLAVTAVFPPLIYLALCLPAHGYGAPLARWLGAVSYPIYALHVPLYNLLAPALESRIDSDSPWLAGIFAACLIPLCMFLNRYFDQPVRRQLMAYAEAGYARLGRWKTETPQRR